MRRVLIANRGEIAVRIARACRQLGLESVAVFSEADKGAVHTLAADRAVAIGPAPARASYLNVEALLAAAHSAGADAVHPGYGFLAENGAFARAVEEAGLTWVGPPPAAITTMGDKLEARATVERAGVPLVPGGTVADPRDAARRAAALGYPVLVKAAAGGGGKGMRVVANEAELTDALAAARREAESAFADGRVYLEKLLVRPRHVEVQVLGDRSGIRVHLGERDCSVQRRHQKLIEESPAPGLAPAVRAGLHRAALTVAAAVNYVSAGTVEFLVDGEGNFYFIEMNTRIQVEHPVTEMLTGVDLVREQVRVAAGEGLGYRQDGVSFSGHTLECRVNAEDPETFAPSAGRVTEWIPPGGFDVRVDSHLMAPYPVPPFYDSLVAKIIVRGRSREEAVARMRRALGETVIEGIRTTIPFLQRVLRDPAFVEGRFTSADGARLHG
jgi:acetyl-CoA carboxylase biotin carboxylase subunit